MATLKANLFIPLLVVPQIPEETEAKMSRLSSSAPSCLLRESSQSVAKNRLAAPPRPRAQNIPPVPAVASDIDDASPINVKTPILSKGADVGEVMRSWQSISDSLGPATNARIQVDTHQRSVHESFSIELAGLSVRSNSLDDESDDTDTSSSLTDRAPGDVAIRPSIIKCVFRCLAQCFQYK